MTLRRIKKTIAWVVLRALFPQELAQVTSAGLQLLRESAPNSPAQGGDQSGQLSLSHLDIHPANPTEQSLSLSASLGAQQVRLSGRVFRLP